MAIAGLGLSALLLWGTPCTAGLIYTWTDGQGVIHISKQPPPEAVKTDDRLAYQPSLKTRTAASSPAGQQSLEEQKAVIEKDMAALRKAADKTRIQAEAAIKTAKAMKRKTDALLAAWQDRKPEPGTAHQLNRRIQATNAAIQKANRLIQKAIDAENRVEEASARALAFNREIETRSRLRVKLYRFSEKHSD